ncbi:hypothetical protein [Streptomyces sp. NPDC058157]|uniref:hypothetical protein n=1 Tax=Streptomyces sp. NPDC058157 TaxID=3346360 RepID=UPI0036E8ADBD
MTTDLRITWCLDGHGWAHCTVGASGGEAELTASHMTSAPEDLLIAVTRLVTGETETRAQFEAEPTAYRWIFYRQAEEVWVRLLELRHGGAHDSKGTEIWSAFLQADELARAVIRCFDEVTRIYGESGYRGKWGEHFPRAELESLRRALASGGVAADDASRPPSCRTNGRGDTHRATG